MGFENTVLSELGLTQGAESTNMYGKIEIESKLEVTDGQSQRGTGFHRANTSCCVWPAFSRMAFTYAGTVFRRFNPLVTFHNNYVPQEPQQPLLLQICLVSLALSILFSLLVLWGKAQTRLEGANILHAKRVSDTDRAALEMLRATGGIYFSERRVFSIAHNAQAASFLVAALTLTWFAILNV